MKFRLFRTFILGLIGSFGILAGAALASAATTISTNIQTDGTLSVAGTSTLTGLTSGIGASLTGAYGFDGGLTGSDQFAIKQNIASVTTNTEYNGILAHQANEWMI